VPEIDQVAITKTMLLHEFDEAVTCKLLGYCCTEAYYNVGAGANFIPKILTPTLFLVSEDDPFLGGLPIEACRENTKTVLAVTAAGGHCGHLQGLWPLGRSWADEVVMEFIENCQRRLVSRQGDLGL
jgi:abhydrolase domain-containing protein 1/3